jgi:4'-phosphopantetheinyl transferase
MAGIIYWTLSEHVADSPNFSGLAELLSPMEREKYTQMRFPKRRNEWLRGRIAAKHLLRHSHPDFAGLLPQAITISNEPEGAPYYLLNGKEHISGCLSISHRDDLAFCALTLDPQTKIGVDLEYVEARIPGFAHDYFTQTEIEQVNVSAPESRDLLVTLIWSVKEAMLKALGKGLRLDTRQVEVLICDKGGRLNARSWQPLEVHCALSEARQWYACWEREGMYVKTLTVLANSRGMILNPIRV